MKDYKLKLMDLPRHLVYTGFQRELEHLKIETRLIDESFGSVMGECVICTGHTH
jgi:hypothetical protein